MYNRIIQTFLDCAEHVGVPLAAWCRRMSPPKGGDPGAVRAVRVWGRVGVGCGVSAVFTQQSTLRA